MSVIVSISETNGTLKKIQLSDEILQARVNSIELSKGKNIKKCKVIHVAMNENSESFIVLKEWCNQKNKKIIGTIPIDQIVETFNNEYVDAIDAPPGYIIRVAQLFEEVGKSANLKQIIIECLSISSISLKDIIYIKKWLGKDLQICYSAAEIGIICSGTAEQVADLTKCVGFPVSDIQVEIINSNEIRIKSESKMVTEYVDNPEISTKYFKNGWFYPGEKGRFSEDGKLIIIKK